MQTNNTRVVLIVLLVLIASCTLITGIYHPSEWTKYPMVEEEQDYETESESFGAKASAGGVTVAVQPESNEWWIQLYVTPGAKSVDLEWSGGSATATRPDWDSSKQYFTGKPRNDAKISEGQTVTLKVHKLDGSLATMNIQWNWRGGSSNPPSTGGGSGGDSDSLPGAKKGQPVYKGRATWYDAHAAGTPVCRFNTKYCGAPSDRVKGLGTIGPCEKGAGTCQNCERGYCDAPGCKAPQCGKGSCGKKVKIWCIDTTCKTKEPIVMTINSMCPSRHPCNTCKGSRNPCARDDHFDLCEATFFAIAHSQPSWEGLKIAYQPV